MIFPKTAGSFIDAPPENEGSRLELKGTVLSTLKQNAFVESMGKTVKIFQIQIPAQPGRYMLRATITGPSGTITSRRRLNVLAE